MADTKEDTILNETKYRYVKVVFNNMSFCAYSYRDDRKLARKYDFVIVPTGVNNEEKLARVVYVRDYCESDVPYPLDKTKSVIRLATEAEIDACEDW